MEPLKLSGKLRVVDFDTTPETEYVIHATVMDARHRKYPGRYIAPEHARLCDIIVDILARCEHDTDFARVVRFEAEPAHALNRTGAVRLFEGDVSDQV